MIDGRFLSLFGLGALTGAFLAVQTVLNATMGQRVGILGSVLVLTVVGLSLTLIFIMLIPSSASFRSLPGRSEWYLYLGAVMGFGIMIAPIFLIPRIGATSTLTALVMGQLLTALVVDHFGLLAVPKIEIDLPRAAGVILIVLGAYLVSR